MEEVQTTMKKTPKPARKRQNSQSVGSDYAGGGGGTVMTNSFGRRVTKPSLGDYEKPNGIKVGRSNSLDDKYNGDEIDPLRKSDKVKPRKRSDSKGDRSNSLKLDRGDDNLNLFSAALDYGRDGKINGGTRSERRQQRGSDARTSRDMDAKHEQRDGFDFLGHLDFGKYSQMSGIQGDLDRMQDLMFADTVGSRTAGKDKQNEDKLARGKVARRNRSLSKGESHNRRGDADKTDIPYTASGSSTVAPEDVNNHKVKMICLS
jgi:hypothetical protein